MKKSMNLKSEFKSINFKGSFLPLIIDKNYNIKRFSIGKNASSEDIYPEIVSGYQFQVGDKIISIKNNTLYLGTVSSSNPYLSILGTWPKACG